MFKFIHIKKYSTLHYNCVPVSIRYSRCTRLCALNFSPIWRNIIWLCANLIKMSAFFTLRIPLELPIWVLNNQHHMMNIINVENIKQVIICNFVHHTAKLVSQNKHTFIVSFHTSCHFSPKFQVWKLYSNPKLNFVPH